jgi:methylmalonyl-CoA mutase, C-terminal domain
MREKGIGDVLLTGGGIIPKEDMAALRQMGVGELFGPGTPTGAIVSYIRTWAEEHRSVKTGAAR